MREAVSSTGLAGRFSKMRVAGEHIDKGAIVDDICPSLVFLDDFSGTIEVAAPALSGSYGLTPVS